MPDERLTQAITLARAGRKTEARTLLEQVLAADPRSELAWLWLADCAVSADERIEILEACLREIPGAHKARAGLAALRRAEAARLRDSDDPPPAEVDAFEPVNAFTIDPKTVPPEEFAQVEARTEAVLRRQPVMRPLKIQQERARKKEAAQNKRKQSQSSHLTPARLGLFILLTGLGILGIVIFIAGLLSLLSGGEECPMPTNLPPEFFQIDKRYRAAETTEERIELLEELLGTIPKHKGTEKLRADYKTRLAKLRTAAQSQKGKSRHASSFHIPAEGAGQVALIGATNTGKSALLRALTNAEPEVAPSPYTTWEPLPGMIEMEGVQVQLIDTPSLDRPIVEPELFELIRRADLLLLAFDLTGDPFQQLEDALALLQSHRIIPEQLKSELEPSALEEGPRKWIQPLVVIANKCDDPAADLDCQVFCELTEGKWPVLPVSALNGRNLDRLKQAVLDRLDVIRVYAKPPGKDPDLTTPFVMKSGSTLEELGGRIHKDFLQSLKFARVWGKSVHDGQMVSREYVLQDGDIVELHV